MKQTQNQASEATIVGRVNETDVDGELIIVTEEEDFFVAMNKVGRRLNSYLDEMVEATGTVSRDREGNLLITVHRFESLEDDWEDEEADDDFDYEDDRWED